MPKLIYTPKALVKANYAFYRVEGDTVRGIRVSNEKQDFYRYYSELAVYLKKEKFIGVIRGLCR